ncbi:hypothetical protein CVT24_012976 [Panaeolus cyanescens]|uniref:Uncharacterized protein n=1 Tax=Panaeolus cyanescens TaxID=181874 RepID=A0A409YUH9_9AGAR|nr:hypothetical protein CVT24_012976 [Panaeolus cyanescens]
MPLLEVDPNTEVAPSYDAPELLAVLQTRLQPDETIEQLVAQMKDSWETARQLRVEQWNQQEAERLEQERLRLAEAEAERVRREEEAAARAAKEKEERERDEREKRGGERKVKVNPLAKGKKVDTTYIARPTQYALQRIKSFDYVELYYFTPEGCENGAKEDKSTGDCAVAASRIDDKIVLQSVSALKASSKVVEDAKLNWGQVLVAQTLLLEQMEKAEWPAELILSLRTFFYELSNDSMHRREMGPEAIILYQAQVRREWWDALKSPAGEAFDIGIINRDRLEQIYTENLSRKYLREVKTCVFRFEEAKHQTNEKTPPPTHC